jgi:transforming growth factor-beta-induced protein
LKTFSGFSCRTDDRVVLAPNDGAFAAYQKLNQGFGNDLVAVKALLEYHLVNGTFPSAAFDPVPQFVPTCLSNPNYTNVTGGQRVEFGVDNNKPVIISGIKAQTSLVQSDILYQGGVIQVSRSTDKET